MGQNSIQVQVQPEGKKEGIPEEATPRGTLKNGREFGNLIGGPGGGRFRQRGQQTKGSRQRDPPGLRPHPASHPLRPLCVLGSLRLPTPGRLRVPHPLRLERTRDHTASDPTIGNSDSAFKVSKQRKIRV